jgi:hypothetical protein
MKTASRLALFGLAALTLCRGQGVISTVAGNGGVQSPTGTVLTVHR